MISHLWIVTYVMVLFINNGESDANYKHELQQGKQGEKEYYIHFPNYIIITPDSLCTKHMLE